MSIPNQLPQIVAAARSGALQALALQAGQQIEGKVIGPAPNGGTQVQIAGKMLNLVLPTLVTAGETLKFEVQGSGAQVKLALQPAAQPASTPLPTPSPAPVSAQPNTLPLPPARPTPPPPIQTQSQVASPPSAPPIAAGQLSATPATALQSAPPQPAGLLPTPPVLTAQPDTPAPASPTSPAALPGQPPVAATANAAPPSVTVPSVTPASVMPVPPIAVPATAPAATTIPLAGPQLPPQQPYPAAPPRVAVVASPAPAAPVPAALARPNAGGPSVAGQQPPPVAAQPPVAAMPTTPQAALAQMVQAALPRQDSIASLTQALTSIAGKVVLPEPVVRAAQQILAGQVAIDSDVFDGATLQKAIMRSGVFQEASLARTGTPLLTQGADMKSSLLALRQTLTTWLGQQAPLTPASQIPPPIRGHVPRAKLANAPPIDAKAAPDEVGKQLLERTEAALSRVRLHQSASLPDPVAKAADWSMDLPVLVGQHQTLLQLQIHRDEHGEAEASTERGWQMRFAINLPGMGEVGAQVSLRGSNTGVMLWAAERSTSDALEADAVSLRDALAAVGLKPGAVIVRHGEPPVPPAAPSGHFVDAST